MSSILATKEIKIVIHFEHWKDDGDYDRLGINNEYLEILGVNIKKLRVPVRPGRNIAVIIETASSNTTPVEIIEKRMMELEEE